MELPNGSWSGSIGILSRGEAVMSANVYSVSEKRSQVLDFGETIYIDEQTVSYLRPELKPDVRGFIKPYSWPLWLAVMVTICIVSVAILLIQYFDNLVSLYVDPKKHKLTSSEKVGYKQIQWSIFTLLNQSLMWSPRRQAVRIVCGIWAITAFILSVSYSGNLVAMLITHKLELPFNNFRQLAKTNIPIWTPAGSRFNEALLASPSGTKLGDIKKNMILTANATEGREGFYDGKWGIADVRRALIYYIHYDFSKKGDCKFYVMDDGVLQTTKLSFGYPRGSKLREKVDPIVINLREFGIIDHLFRNRVKNATRCLNEDFASGFTKIQRPLALGDFYGVFYVYLGGTGLSIICFFFEYVVGIHYRNNTATKKPKILKTLNSTGLLDELSKHETYIK